MPGLGRSVCRAAVVVRSVKLVHQRIESGEAGMFSWPMLPVSSPRRSCSARFCRSVEPPFRRTCRCQVPARSHDGSPCANPFRGDSHSYRSNSPWPQRVKFPTGIRSCSDANECDPIPTIASVESSSPPLSTRARRARRLKSPGCRSQAPPLPQALILVRQRLTRRASTAPTGHPVADSTRACADQFGGGPTDDRRRRRTRSRTRSRTVSRLHATS